MTTSLIFYDREGLVWKITHTQPYHVFGHGFVVFTFCTCNDHYRCTGRLFTSLVTTRASEGSSGAAALKHRRERESGGTTTEQVRKWPTRCYELVHSLLCGACQWRRFDGRRALWWRGSAWLGRSPWLRRWRPHQTPHPPQPTGHASKSRYHHHTPLFALLHGISRTLCTASNQLRRSIDTNARSFGTI